MNAASKDARDIVERWHLGQTSQRYESSGAGAGTVSSGKNDHGGASYGSYQLSSREGTVQEYLAQSRYGVEFNGLVPATPAFDARWRAVAARDRAFGADQHDFIGRSHYAQQLERLRDAGLDMRARGRAVQDCVWSTSVQFRNLTPVIFKKGLHERFGSDVDVSTLTDAQIIDAVQAHKITHNATLFANSPKWQANLRRRAEHERRDLLELAEAERMSPSPIHADPNSVHPVPTREHGPRHPPRRPHQPRASGSATAHAQAELAHLGYTGTDGRLIESDGRSGPNTRHALAQYQHDHRLSASGTLDPTTRARLDRDDHTMASSAHPAHQLYVEAMSAVATASRQRGVEPGSHTTALAGVVAVQAARAGLTHVNRVEISRDGMYAQAVEFRGGVDVWATNRTSAAIDVANAVRQSLETSSDQARRAIDVRTPDLESSVREHRPMRAPVL